MDCLLPLTHQVPYMPDSFNFGFNQNSDPDSLDADAFFDSGFDSGTMPEDSLLHQREITPPRLNLNRTPGEPPLMVDMQAFFEFTFWMAEELLDLEAQHRQPIRSRDRGLGGGRMAPLD